MQHFYRNSQTPPNRQTQTQGKMKVEYKTKIHRVKDKKPRESTVFEGHVVLLFFPDLRPPHWETGYLFKMGPNTNEWRIHADDQDVWLKPTHDPTHWCEFPPNPKTRKR